RFFRIATMRTGRIDDGSEEIRTCRRWLYVAVPTSGSGRAENPSRRRTDLDLEAEYVARQRLRGEGSGTETLARRRRIGGTPIGAAERHLGDIRHRKPDFVGQHAARIVAPRAPTAPQADPDTPFRIAADAVGITVSRINPDIGPSGTEHPPAAHRIGADLAG